MTPGLGPRARATHPQPLRRRGAKGGRCPPGGSRSEAAIRTREFPFLGGVRRGFGSPWQILLKSAHNVFRHASSDHPV